MQIDNHQLGPPARLHGRTDAAVLADWAMLQILDPTSLLASLQLLTEFGEVLLVSRIGRGVDVPDVPRLLAGHHRPPRMRRPHSHVTAVERVTGYVHTCHHWSVGPWRPPVSVCTDRWIRWTTIGYVALLAMIAGT